VFNASRGSEDSELTVEEYNQASFEVDPTVSDGFTDVEKQLLTNSKFGHSRLDESRFDDSRDCQE